MSAITPFQPTLPAEGAFTDAEIAFMEDSPPGLFPENQNSNFGFVIRKIFTDKIQQLIGQQQTLYNERFVETALTFLDVWEGDYGLPVAPTGRTVAQRRQDILSRIQVGPYTRARRRTVVENFISATFGAGVLLTPAGVPIGAGIPLYSGASSFVGLYAIRENYTWKNLLANSSFEVNTTGWTPVGTAVALTRITSDFKYGAAALQINSGTGILQQASVQALASGVVGAKYTASAWVKAGNVQTNGKTLTLSISEVGGTSTSNTIVLSNTAWKRISVSRTLLTTNAVNVVIGEVTGGATGDIQWVDGVQFESGLTLTDWSDPAGSDFFYEVRILNTVTPDLIGLTRELTRITPAGISFAIVSTPNP